MTAADILFHRVNFPLTEAASVDAIAARLDQLADLRRASATFWNWLGDRAASGAKAKVAKGIIFNSSMEDGSPVLGTIELNESFVLFEAKAGRCLRGPGVSLPTPYRFRFGMMSYKHVSQSMSHH